jgi:hypothetical protein
MEITGKDGTAMAFSDSTEENQRNVSRSWVISRKTIRSLRPYQGSSWVYQNKSQVSCRLNDLLCSEIYHRCCFQVLDYQSRIIEVADVSRPNYSRKTVPKYCEQYGSILD